MRVNRKPSKSPSPMASLSPKSTILNKSRSYYAKSNKKPIAKATAVCNSPPSHKTLTSISDLRDLASSHDDIKRNIIDLSHSEILKDLEASHSRLRKRFKIQTQACQQVMDETEKDYKKMSEQICESLEGMKASYAELMAGAQATASR
ncbi:LOW QUALITY PROTEIN: hypothetical protein CFOL_v3_29919, partial [Cephalotus follicularis]